MRKYEIMYIVRSTLGEDEVKSLNEKLENAITKGGAKVLSSKDLGQKELAYEIEKQRTGHYFLIEIETEDYKILKEFDRITSLDKGVLRHLITNLEK